MTQYLETPQGRRIAYNQTEGKGPGVVFLSGLKSDMEGTKAVHLEAWCRAQGRAFLRFDYSGHGVSSGAFTDGCIGDWHQDTLAVFDAVTKGPQIVVGSSMGGWQSLLLAKARPERIAGLVGIAAAPDFTLDGYETNFTAEQHAEMEANGQVLLPSEYDEGYVITQRLIDDGRDQLVLRSPLDLPFPVRLMQGTDDTAVPTSQAVKLLEHATSPDMRLTLVKDADHRFSAPDCLSMIEDAITDILARI